MNLIFSILFVLVGALLIFNYSTREDLSGRISSLENEVYENEVTINALVEYHYKNDPR